MGHQKKIHDTKYNYDKTTLIGDRANNIYCPSHGMFSQLIRVHTTNKSGCSECGTSVNGINKRLTKEKFIEKAKITHGETYSYDNVIYSGAHTKVSVTCKLHGDFHVTPVNHWSNGIGCQHCKNSNPSKGERKVANFLDENGFIYTTQKTYTDLYHNSKNSKLRYDFFIPSINTLIEFNGEYHYIPQTFSKNISAQEQFDLTQIRDKLKEEYATTNDIKLIKIRYDENIESKLRSSLL